VGRPVQQLHALVRHPGLAYTLLSPFSFINLITEKQYLKSGNKLYSCPLEIICVIAESWAKS
jgi:hypothetical protein